MHLMVNTTTFGINSNLFYFDKLSENNYTIHETYRVATNHSETTEPLSKWNPVTGLINILPGEKWERRVNLTGVHFLIGTLPVSSTVKN